jgi:hypothetical protein
LNQYVQNCSPAGKTQLPAFLKCKWQDSGVAKGGCGQFISPRYFAENMPKSAVGRMETTSSQPGAMGFEPAVHLRIYHDQHCQDQRTIRHLAVSRLLVHEPIRVLLCAPHPRSAGCPSADRRGGQFRTVFRSLIFDTGNCCGHS